MSIKFNIEYSLARTMFRRSNIDYYLADGTSDTVNEYVWNIHERGLICEKMSIRSNIQYSMAEITSE